MAYNISPALKKAFKVPRSIRTETIRKPDETPSAVEESIGDGTEQLLVDLFVKLIDKKVNKADFCSMLKTLWKRESMKPLRDMLESTGSDENGSTLHYIKELRDEDDRPCEVDGVDDYDDRSEVDGIEDWDEGCEDYCGSISSDSTSVDEDENDFMDLMEALQSQGKGKATNEQKVHHLLDRIIDESRLTRKRVQQLSTEDSTDENRIQQLSASVTTDENRIQQLSNPITTGENSRSNMHNLDKLPDKECEPIVNGNEVVKKPKILVHLKRKQASSNARRVGGAGKSVRKQKYTGFQDEDEDEDTDDFEELFGSYKKNKRKRSKGSLNTSNEVPQSSKKVTSRRGRGTHRGMVRDDPQI